ncbi:MAG: VRR-NUC domain-containing protein [Gammaproteobacteria bacterium]|nr:VRR-NUC domain-containing protein [Gammaproteobacteria bacterium]
MLPELPQDYYLDNVLTLLGHVRRVYADILDPEQLDFLAVFDALDDDARRLYVRLLNRSGCWFRQDKLHYAEIGDLAAAIERLVSHGCLATDAAIEPADLLSLYTRPELLDALGRPAQLRGLRRAQLDELLADDSLADFHDQLRQRNPLLQVLRQDEYELCQMLFFGNLSQSMTDFVLRDLGLYQFESYRVDQAHRPYRNQLEIRQHWLIHQLELLFRLGDPGDSEALAEILDYLPADIDADAPAWRKSERLRHDIARQLERNGELDAALALYRQCPLPPSRERIIRILAGRGEAETALQRCAEILAQPLDDEEAQFAAAFALRLARRNRLEPPAAARPALIDHQPPVVELELAPQDSVELAVAAHYRELDGEQSCFYVENSLFNGVFGLWLWDVIFAPVSGAFYHPFQYRPRDFYEPGFIRRRAAQLERAWREIGDIHGLVRIVEHRWQAKHGLMNPLVNWAALDLELLRRALHRIPLRDWRMIFERLLLDLRNHRAGLPDLVRFPPDGGYELIEVKGPGDSLQKNQQRWMNYFHARDIPHRLARVTWQAS